MSPAATVITLSDVAACLGAQLLDIEREVLGAADGHAVDQPTTAGRRVDVAVEVVECEQACR